MKIDGQKEHEKVIPKQVGDPDRLLNFAFVISKYYQCTSETVVTTTEESHSKAWTSHTLSNSVACQVYENCIGKFSHCAKFQNWQSKDKEVTY